MTMTNLTTFLGWCLVVHLGFYLFIVLALLVGRRLVAAMSARLFGVDGQTAMTESYLFVARYKLLVIVFFLTPYVALKLMG